MSDDENKPEHRFSAEEIKEQKDIFMVYDKEGDSSGKLDSDTALRAMRAAGLCLTNKDAEEIVTDLDIYKDSVCDRDEYLRLLRVYWKKPPSTKDIMDAFNALDTDGSGSISTQELYHTLRSLGESVTKDEADELVKAADKDGDGEIDYKEFTALMCTPLLNEREQKLSRRGSVRLPGEGLRAMEEEA